MKILPLVFLSLSFSAHALETDNYLAWGRELPDSGDDINRLILREIEEVISETSPKAETSCRSITFRIAKRFKTSPGKKLFEDYSEDHLSAQMYPETPYYLRESIYRNTKRVYLSRSGLSPNLQTKGIYFGVDKLSHFGSTGRRYLKHYLKKLKRGYSPEEAEKSAIRFGLANEAGILGLWPSGVLSYGDMEANYQGLRFYKKFCLDEKDTYLEKSAGSWRLAKAPDIRDFVNPYWDETFNLSYRSPGMWAVSSPIISAEYCPLKSSESVQNRFKLYRDLNHTSPSLTYIEELKRARYKHAFTPQEVCQAIQ